MRNTTEFSKEMHYFANLDLLSVVQVLAAKRSKAGMELFIALCWATWHSLNLFIFERKKEDSQESLAKVEAIMESYRKIRQKTKFQQLETHALKA